LKRANVLPLTLGPFGAKLYEVFESLAHIISLDEGVEITINRRPRLVCAFISAIFRDMPAEVGWVSFTQGYASMPLLLYL
jgi:hypothetical protein